MPRRKYHPYHRRILERDLRKREHNFAFTVLFVAPFFALFVFLVGVVREAEASPDFLTLAEDRPETYRDHTAAVEAFYVETVPSALPPIVVPPVESGGHGVPSQGQKDATAVACAHAYETHADDIVAAGWSRGVYMTDCYSTLLGIAQSESSFNNKAKNESKIEHSYGAFQLNLDVHRHVTREQAEDYTFAVNWTIERLHAYGYPKFKTHAIQCHNGCGANNGYAERVKERASLHK